MPPTVILVVANLVPLAGVLWWGWDAFILLILYWCETVIIAFWTIVRIVLGPAIPVSDGHGALMSAEGMNGRFAMAAFFTAHSGIFITVHLVLLWTLFSGGWSVVIHGPVGFVRDLILGTDLWIPLVILFFVRGYMVLGPTVRRRLGFVDDAEPDHPASPLAGLYVRIFVMQVTIIAGGWFVVLLGDSVGPLVLLVLAKTVAEAYFDPMIDKRSKADAKADAAAATDRTPAD